MELPESTSKSSVKRERPKISKVVGNIFFFLNTTRRGAEGRITPHFSSETSQEERGSGLPSTQRREGATINPDFHASKNVSGKQRQKEEVPKATGVRPQHQRRPPRRGRHGLSGSDSQNTHRGDRRQTLRLILTVEY